MTEDDYTPANDGWSAEKPTIRSRRAVLKASAVAGLGAVSLPTGSPAAAAQPDVDRSNFHVYLLFGQSNMEGVGEVAPRDRETNSRVRVLQNMTCPDLDREFGEWYVAEPPLNRCGDGLGPGDYFGKTMVAELPERISIGLVPAAVSGADIALFEKGAPIGRNDRDIPPQFSGGYEWLLDLAQQAQEVGVIEGILFHQGETNTDDPDWKYQVQEIVSDLRSDLGIGNVPFLAGEVLYGGCCDSHNSEIAQLPDLIPNAHVVSAEGLEGADYAHFTAEGYRELGRRYAEEMLEHVDVSTVESDDPDCPAGATDPDGDGLCEDVNGNGRADTNDVVQFFNAFEDEVHQDNAARFDFNESGSLEIADVVELFQRL